MSPFLRFGRCVAAALDADGFPGNYTKLPAPVRVKPEVVGEVVDWLAERLVAP